MSYFLRTLCFTLYISFFPPVHFNLFFSNLFLALFLDSFFLSFFLSGLLYFFSLFSSVFLSVRVTFYILSINPVLTEFRGCPPGIIVKAMDCRIGVSEFELHLRY